MEGWQRVRADEPILGGCAEISFPFEEYRKLRFGESLCCPRCGSIDAAPWGSFSGRRRYRCRGCARTFSDFTGTPLAYLKRLDQWPGHCASALAHETLRREAARLGIHRNTAFRWRHRLLAALRTTDSAALSGVVALRETPFPVSEKGSRKLTRPARRRRWAAGAQSLGAPSVWVIVALAGDGRVATAVTDSRRPTDRDYVRLLAGRLAPGVRLTSSHGDEGAPALSARRIRVMHDPASRRGRECAAASAYVFRLRTWIRRFRGVATRYLPNYLVWHRFLHTLRVIPVAGLPCLLAATFP
jgi:transposase-like protein